MDYDIIIIGGGPGGYTAAIRASELGAKVALVEEDFLGGTCLNRGCIPTKVYAHAAQIINKIKKADQFGINATFSLNTDKLRNKKENVVNKLVNGVEYLMKLHNIDVIRGRAKFIDEHTIKTDKNYTAKKFIIATGSKTLIPPIPGIGLESVITSDEALKMEKMPQKIVIIGAGIIGLEFANIYSSLGSKVYIIEMLPDLLPMIDKEISEILLKSLKKKKIELYLDSKVEMIEEGMKVIFNNRGIKEEIDCDTVLVAAGRTANINGIEALNLNIDKKGIKVDNQMKTNIDNIYAIGDVTGTIQLAHIAAYQGIIAAHNALGDKKQFNLDAIPSCVYTIPEIAWVGLNETEAKAKYKDIKIGTFPYAISGRAMTIGENDGVVKIIAESKYKQIVGMEIIGESATEIIHEGVLAIKGEFTAEEFVETIHAHPTISESIKEACEDLLGFPINKG